MLKVLKFKSDFPSCSGRISAVTDTSNSSKGSLCKHGDILCLHAHNIFCHYDEKDNISIKLFVWLIHIIFLWCFCLDAAANTQPPSFIYATSIYKKRVSIPEGLSLYFKVQSSLLVTRNVGVSFVHTEHLHYGLSDTDIYLYSAENCIKTFHMDDRLNLFAVIVEYLCACKHTWYFTQMPCYSLLLLSFGNISDHASPLQRPV